MLTTCLAVVLPGGDPRPSLSGQPGTVTRLGLSPSLLRTFKTTNPVESMILIARDAHQGVKRWRSGEMALGGRQPPREVPATRGPQARGEPAALGSRR